MGLGRSNAGSINDIFALIRVEYAEGWTCVCSDGNMTITAIDDGKAWLFNIPYAGIWTASVTNGVYTLFKKFEIVAGACENVTFGDFMLYGVENDGQDGMYRITNLDITASPTSGVVIFEPINGRSNLTIRFATDSYTRVRISSPDPVQLSTIDTLTFKLRLDAVFTYSDMKCYAERSSMYIGITKDPPNSMSSSMLYRNERILSPADFAYYATTIDLDVSDLDGLYYICIFGYLDPPTPGTEYRCDFYLYDIKASFA